MKLRGRNIDQCTDPLAKFYGISLKNDDFLTNYIRLFLLPNLVLDFKVPNLVKVL